jgi:hypothetical protein
MGRLTDDDIARLRGNVISRVSKISTQLADFKLNRSTIAAYDARERVLFVAENNRNVNRILKEFHDSRIANGQQDRADRMAFVADMVKERAKFLEQATALRKGLLKDIDKESSEFIAEAAISISSAAALIKEGSPHFDEVGTKSEVASKQFEPAIDAGVVTSEVHAGLLNTSKAIAPVSPKAAAPAATPKAAAPAATPKAAAPATTPKAAAPATTPKAAAPATTPKAAATATNPKAAAPATTPKAAATATTPKADAPATPKVAAPASPKSAAPAAPKSVKSKRNN